MRVRRSESSTQLKVHSSPSGESGEWESLESGRGVIKVGLQFNHDRVNVNRTEGFQPRSQPRQGSHVYRYGQPGLRPAELVKLTGNAASQMRPDVFSGRGESINMQPLTGLATSVVKVRRSESSTQLKVHSSPSGES